MDLTKNETRNLADFHRRHSTKEKSSNKAIVAYINQCVGSDKEEEEEEEEEVTGCQTPQYTISLISKTRPLFFVRVLSFDCHYEKYTCQ